MNAKRPLEERRTIFTNRGGWLVAETPSTNPDEKNMILYIRADLIEGLRAFCDGDHPDILGVGLEIGGAQGRTGFSNASLDEAFAAIERARMVLNEEETRVGFPISPQAELEAVAGCPCHPEGRA